MKTILKTFIGFISAIAGVGVPLMNRFQNDTRRILTRVADAGYETALDILFPGEESKEEKLHYGPVIPD